MHAAGIIAHEYVHALDPMGSDATAATPGIHVSTYTSADPTAATALDAKSGTSAKQKATSCAVHNARNAKVTVQSVCLNGNAPAAATRNDTRRSGA